MTKRSFDYNKLRGLFVCLGGSLALHALLFSWNLPLLHCIARVTSTHVALTRAGAEGFYPVEPASLTPDPQTSIATETRSGPAPSQPAGQRISQGSANAVGLAAGTGRKVVPASAPTPVRKGSATIPKVIARSEPIPLREEKNSHADARPVAVEGPAVLPARVEGGTQTEVASADSSSAHAVALAKPVKQQQQGSGMSKNAPADAKSHHADSGKVLRAVPLYAENPKPEYPRLARKSGWQGVVRLEVLVRQDGRAGHVSLLESSGYQQLDRSAMKTVYRWRFVPARLAGVAIESTVEVPVNFVLN